MEKSKRFVKLTFKLYTIEDGKETFIDEMKEDQPLKFVTGFHVLSDAFENAVCQYKEGEEFEINLKDDDCLGELDAGKTIELDKNVFKKEDGTDEVIAVGDKIQLELEVGNILPAHITEITADKVKIMFDHPDTEKELLYKGKVLENREATQEEIEQMNEFVNQHHHHHDCNCSHDHCHCHGNCECGK